MASLVLLGKFHAALIAREFAGLNFCECLHHITAHRALYLRCFWLHGLHLIDSRQPMLAHDSARLHFRVSLYDKKTPNPSLNLTEKMTPSANLGEAERVWAVKTALPPSSPIEWTQSTRFRPPDNLLLMIDLPILAVQPRRDGFSVEE